VPLDGSKLGEAALPYVENLAIMARSEVVLFQAVAPLDDIMLVAGQQEGMGSYASNVCCVAAGYVEGLRDGLAAKGILVRTEVHEGHPAESIVDFANREGIDLIAMSTHGRSGIRRWVFGSIADKVLHAADIPVLLIRASGGANE